MFESAPECPAVLLYLWEYFCDLSPGLSVNGMTYPTVTWEALAAWSQFTQTVLEPWEARTLVRLGQVRFVVMSERKK